MRPLLTLLLLLASGSAWPAENTLLPASSAVELRAYGFGLIPLDGKFTRFHGLMRYDPANTGACEVVLEIEAASLAMGSESVRDTILGPGMMDAAQYPALAFRGACQGDQVTGDLTLHGETHPFTLAYTRTGETVVATGRLRRAEWGITGNSLAGGSTIRIRVVLPDPFGPRHS